MMTVTFEIPEGLCAALHRSPREIEKEVRLAAAIEWYRQRRISQGRAAEIAGIPRADFIEALAERKIEGIQITPEELVQEVEVARSGVR